MQRRTFLLSTLPLLMPKLSFSMPTSHTGIVLDQRFADHLIDSMHPESPQRYLHFTQKLAASSLNADLQRLSPDRDATPWIGSIHSEKHIASIKRHHPKAYQAALLACSGVLSAVDAVHAKQVNNAFCASRPPGHHATNSGKEEGFCYFNHIAVAARYLQQQYGYKKVLIVDWDYHHGNGTEWAFYDDPSVLFFSTHDMMAYPQTGLPARTGIGKGEGYNINVHLPCGSDNEALIAAFENHLVPAVKHFSPDFILISAGFDSHQADILGCHEITAEGFTAVTQIVKKMAQDYCEGRLVSVMEGGYSLQGNALSALAHLHTLYYFN